MSTSPPATTANRPAVQGTPAPRRRRWTTKPPGEQGKGKVAHPECPEWVRELAVPYDGEAEFLIELDRKGAAKSHRAAFRYLVSACRQYFQAGTYESLRTMAAKSNLPLSTLRKALRWLEFQGLIVRVEAEAAGRVVVMTWCLWLVDPARLEGARPVPGRRAISGRPGPRPARALSGRQPCPKEDTNCSKWISSGEKETTDRVRGDSSSSSSAAPVGEDPECVPAPVAAPELAPEVFAELVKLDEPERSDVEAEAPGWLARWKLAWVVLAIRETAEARKRRPVHNFASFAAKMLENWGQERRPTPRHCKVPAVAPGSNGADRPEAIRRAEAESKARDEAAKAAREASLKARWASLPDSDRAAIVARVEADNPQVVRFKGLLEPLCLAALESAGSPSIE